MPRIHNGAHDGFSRFHDNYRATPYRRVVTDPPEYRNTTGNPWGPNYERLPDRYEKVPGTGGSRVVEGTSYQERDARSGGWRSITREAYEKARKKLLGG